MLLSSKGYELPAPGLLPINSVYVCIRGFVVVSLGLVGHIRVCKIVFCVVFVRVPLGLVSHAWVYVVFV